MTAIAILPLKIKVKQETYTGHKGIVLNYNLKQEDKEEVEQFCKAVDSMIEEEDKSQAYYIYYQKVREHLFRDLLEEIEKSKAKQLKSGTPFLAGFDAAKAVVMKLGKSLK